jgi:hypothetical protein
MYRVFYAILFYFVDYGIPLSQIKIVLFILANRECLIRRRHCINIVFIFAGQWKARVFLQCSNFRKLDMKTKEFEHIWHLDKNGYNCSFQKPIYLGLFTPPGAFIYSNLNPHRGCSGSQKVGARKIARCHFQVPVLKVGSQFRRQLRFLQGDNFFEPKQWIACTTTSFMFSFMYKWSGFVCTNVNVCIVLLFFISISSSKTKRFICLNVRCVRILLFSYQLKTN